MVSLTRKPDSELPRSDGKSGLFPSARRLPYFQHPIGNILRIMFAALLALAVWEVILENCVLREPGGASSPVLGRILKPGIYVQGTEGYCRTRMNSLGMRGPEIGPKSSTEYRILMLGDSFTEALQVSDDKTFGHLLQVSLTRKTGRDIKVVNAGRNGASPAYYIHLADFYNSSMKPDHVIVQINDEDFTKEIMDNNTREFYVKKDGDCYLTETGFKDYYIWQMFPPLKVIKPFVAFSTFKIALDKIPMMLDRHMRKTASAGQDGPAAVPCDDIIDWTVKTLKSDYPNISILYLTLNKSESNVESLLKMAVNKYKVDFVNMRLDFSDYYMLNIQPVNGFDNTMPGEGHINEIGHAIVGERMVDYFMEKVFK